MDMVEGEDRKGGVRFDTADEKVVFVNDYAVVFHRIIEEQAYVELVGRRRRSVVLFVD